MFKVTADLHTFIRPNLPGGDVIHYLQKNMHHVMLYHTGIDAAVISTKSLPRMRLFDLNLFISQCLKCSTVELERLSEMKHKK